MIDNALPLTYNSGTGEAWQGDNARCIAQDTEGPAYPIGRFTDG